MKLNINQIDLLQNLTKVENNTFWELVKLADENKRIILDMDEKEKVLSILDTTVVFNILCHHQISPKILS